MVIKTTNVLKVKRQSLTFRVVEGDDHELSLEATQEENFKTVVGCGKNRCKTCQYVSTQKTVHNCTTNKNFWIELKTNDTVTCDTKNVIYLLTCKKCSLQYIGETSQSLKQRFGQHRRMIQNSSNDTLVYKHFNASGHTLDDVAVLILEVLPTADKKQLHEKELKWIKLLNTGYPFGFNDKILNYGCITKKCTDSGMEANNFTLSIKIKGLHKTKRGIRKRRKKIIDYTAIDNLLEIYNNNDKDKVRQLYRYYRSLNKATISYLKKEILSNDYILEFKLLCIGVFLETKKEPKNEDGLAKPKKYVPILYVNEYSQKLNPASLFNSKKLRSYLSDNLANNKFIISWKCGNPVRKEVCNYSSFLNKLTNEEIQKILNENCKCEHSKFVYSPYGHVITGNLDIIQDEHTRDMLSKGAKHRMVYDDSWQTAYDEIINGMRKFIGALVNQRRIGTTVAANYENNFKIMLSARQKAVFRETDDVPNLVPVNQQNNKNFYKTIKRLQEQYIITPADKAANNYIFICKKLYVSWMCKELGVSVESSKCIAKGNDTYKAIKCHEKDLIRKHNEEFKNFGVEVNEDNQRIPILFGIAKMHKVPYGMRFIAGAKNCTTKAASQKLLSILQFFKVHFKNYCAAIINYSNKHCYWSIENSCELLKTLNRHKDKFVSIFTGDFSTLYTKLPLDIVEKSLFQLIDMLCKNANASSVAISKNRRKIFYVKGELTQDYEVWHKQEIKEFIHYLVNETFIRFGGFIFQQQVGIPMGGNASPLICDLTLGVMELNFVSGLKGKEASEFQYCYRYIDDVIAFNCPEFLEQAKRIYHPSLPLNKTNTSDKLVQYLDCEITICPFSIKVYDKTKDFNFGVTKILYNDSNVPRHIASGVIRSQAIRFARISSDRQNFHYVCRDLCTTLQRHGFDTWYICETITAIWSKYESTLYKFNIYEKKDFLKFVLSLLD